MTEDFFSVVYVAPNHLTNERISVGLIVVSDGVPFFKFSMTKLKWLSFDLVKAPVKKHMQEVESIILEEQKSKVLRLFNYRFAKEVFDELHKKSRGLIIFDKPQEIQTAVNEAFFNKLFVEMIGAKPNKEADKRTLPMRVKWTHWLRNQKELKGTYQFSLEKHNWVKVDYAEITTDLIKIYHCIDPEISKKSFKRAIEQFGISLGLIQQDFEKVEIILVHGDHLSNSAKKIVAAKTEYNWMSLSEAQKCVADI
jgi:hypothetical protein